jgi:hypothetical protein
MIPENAKKIMIIAKIQLVNLFKAPKYFDYPMFSHLILSGSDGVTGEGHFPFQNFTTLSFSSCNSSCFSGC